MNVTGMQIEKIVQGSFCLSITKTLLILVITVFSIQSFDIASGKKESKFGGVQIGIITYSYRGMTFQSIPAILNYVVFSEIGTSFTPFGEYIRIRC